MNKYLTILAAAAMAGSAMLTPSCDDSSDIGNAITQDSVAIIVDTTFTLTGQSISNHQVLSRSVTQMIGRVDAPGYGSISSEIVTQFMPSNVLDTVGVGVNDIDSLRLVMMLNIGEYTGDSVAPMGLEIYPLTRQLPSPIYSDFDPTGYYDGSKRYASLIYNVSAVGEPDSVKKLKYRMLAVTLPRDLAKGLYSAYRSNPQTYSTPSDFAKVFPGLYIKNTFGNGRVTRIASTTMHLYYHKTYYDENKKKDTTVMRAGNYFAVTPEIVTNNNIKLEIAPEINARVAQGQSVIMAPAGLDVQFRFPGNEMIEKYRANVSKGLGVINTVGISIPVEEIANKYSIKPPTYLLMTLTKDKDKFFLESKIPDNKTSFYATYNTTSGTYEFVGLRDYFLDLLKKDRIADEDITFTLTPISVTYETNSSYYGSTTTVTGVVPYVATPVMARLMIEKSKISLVYSKQTINY